MKAEFIPKFIMLLAGAIVCIITIVNGTDVTYSLEMLLATLIIFYIIGLIVKKIVVKVLEGNMFVKQSDTNNIEVQDQENADQQEEDKEKEEQSAEE